MYASPAQLSEHDETAGVELSALTKLQLKALERQQAHEEFGVEFGSSDSESESSTNTHHEGFSPVAIPKGLGIGYKKPDNAKRTVVKKSSTLSMNESYTSQYDTLSKDSPPANGILFPAWR